MITWIIGNSGSGKTTLAEAILKYRTTDEFDKILHPYYKPVWLDGDNLRGIWTDLKFSKEDRWEHNLRVARLAKMLDKQGHNVVISVICPYKMLRADVKKIIPGIKFIYIEGGEKGKEYPFNHPELY